MNLPSENPPIRDPNVVKDQEPAEDPPALVQWRARIIDSVLTNGLKPASLLQLEGYLGSVDRRPDTRVLGWLLKPIRFMLAHPYQIWDHDLRAALYEFASSSILPVISERPREAKNFLRTIIEREKFVKRASASFLAVCGKDPRGKIVVDNGPRSQIEERQQVLSSALLYVVFPKPILEEYLSIHSILGIKIPFKTAYGIVTRSIEGQEVEILDYETPLNEIVNEVKGPIWVHGIRLPTEEDLALRAF